MNLKIKNALVSVSDKENIISLLKILKSIKLIISSGGTYKFIKKLGTIAQSYQNIQDLRKC